MTTWIEYGKEIVQFFLVKMNGFRSGGTTSNEIKYPANCATRISMEANVAASVASGDGTIDISVLDKLYEPKQNKKIFRIITVIAYIFSVSMVAILLSLYYLFLWDPYIKAHKERMAALKVNTYIIILQDISNDMTNVSSMIPSARPHSHTISNHYFHTTFVLLYDILNSVRGMDNTCEYNDHYRPVGWPSGSIDLYFYCLQRQQQENFDHFDPLDGGGGGSSLPPLENFFQPPKALALEGGPNTGYTTTKKAFSPSRLEDPFTTYAKGNIS